jgi:hypothetical protein
MFADDFRRRVPLETLGSCIPCCDMPGRVQHEDSVILDRRYQQLKCLILIRAFSEFKLPLMLLGNVEEFHLDAAQKSLAQNRNGSQIPGNTRIRHNF